MELMDSYLESDSFWLTSTSAPADSRALENQGGGNDGAPYAYADSHDDALTTALRIRQSSRLDAETYLRALAKLLEDSLPVGRSVHCHIRADDVGYLPEGICRLFGQALCELIKAAASLSTSGPKASVPITIVLRRKGSLVCCGMSTPSLAKVAFYPLSGMRRIEQMGTVLGSSCIVRMIPEHNVLAILLDSEMAQSRISAANRVYQS